MPPTRRQTLGAIGAGTTALLAGCSALDSRPGLDLIVENYRDVRVDVAIQLLDPDAEDRRASVAFSETVRLESRAGDDDPRTWRGEDVAPARPYRVEVDVTEVARRSQHYHYVPDCVSEGPLGSSSTAPAVEITLNDDPGIAFGQTRCGDGIESSP